MSNIVNFPSKPSDDEPTFQERWEFFTEDFTSAVHSLILCNYAGSPRETALLWHSLDELYAGLHQLFDHPEGGKKLMASRAFIETMKDT
jgi:hypothetical protein